MKYLTDEEREFVLTIRSIEDWGDTTSDEIHRLSGAFCWEFYDKYNGEGFDWVPTAYKMPEPV